MVRRVDDERAERFRRELVASLTSGWSTTKMKSAVPNPDAIVDSLVEAYRFHMEEWPSVWREQTDLLERVEAQAGELAQTLRRLEASAPASKGYEDCRIEDASWMLEYARSIQTRIEVLRRDRQRAEAEADAILADRVRRVRAKREAGLSREQARASVEGDADLTLGLAALGLPPRGRERLAGFVLKCLMYHLRPADMAKVEFIATKGYADQDGDRTYEGRQHHFAQYVRGLALEE